MSNKNPSKLQKAKSEGNLSMANQPTETSFFLFVGLVLAMAIQKMSRQTVITHLFFGSASKESGSSIIVTRFSIPVLLRSI